MCNLMYQIIDCEEKVLVQIVRKFLPSDKKTLINIARGIVFTDIEKYKNKDFLFFNAPETNRATTIVITYQELNI